MLLQAKYREKSAKTSQILTEPADVEVPPANSTSEIVPAVTHEVFDLIKEFNNSTPATNVAQILATNAAQILSRVQEALKAQAKHNTDMAEAVKSPLKLSSKMVALNQSKSELLDQEVYAAINAQSLFTKTLVDKFNPNKRASEQHQQLSTPHKKAKNAQQGNLLYLASMEDSCINHIYARCHCPGE
jgi:hypothetical protein